MIESLIIKCNKDESKLNELALELNALPLKELIEIYLGYTNSVYFMRYENISKSLNLIKEKIMNKLNSISIIELIDLYADIYIKTLELTERVEKNKMFINIRESNIKDENFVTGEALRRKVSKEKFLSEYVSAVKNPQKDLECMNESLMFIDELQSSISNYIEVYLNNLSSDKEIIIQELDKRIDSNEKEIQTRNEILHDQNKLNIISKSIGSSIFQTCIMLNPKELETRNDDVYKSFRSIIKDNKNKK